MGRIAVAFLLTLFVASPALAQSGAKLLFGAVRQASVQAPSSLGGYARGCLAGGEQLAETGVTWQAMRLSRNRNWGNPAMIAFIKRLSKFAARQRGWNGLYVGDMSQPRGGPVAGHVSHQIGLDVDIWMRPADRLDLSRAEREAISSISMRRAGGAFVNENWSKAQQNILRAAARDPAVARIFVFPGAKVQMCNDAKGNRKWLRKIRPWVGHYAHFHVRLSCPEGAAGCVDQAPLPPGDGCDAAQAWVDDILDPPPADTTPHAPRPVLVLADLPIRCAAVLQSR
ncbi:MAG: penicillin-insensitive murein endopeptidase [Paracoccaceae bacterium]